MIRITSLRVFLREHFHVLICTYDGRRLASCGRDQNPHPSHNTRQEWGTMPGITSAPPWAVRPAAGRRRGRWQCVTWPLVASATSIWACSSSKPVARSSSSRDFSYAAFAETRLDSLVVKVAASCRIASGVVSPTFRISVDRLRKFVVLAPRRIARPALRSGSLDIAIARWDFNADLALPGSGW